MRDPGTPPSATMMARGARAALAGQASVLRVPRRLNLTIWYALYAERLPELRPRSAGLLAAWPAP
jgi:hypothetical protein